MRTLIALLFVANSLVAAPRVVSPERPVGDRTPSPNVLADPLIDIASNGDTTIAAWSDHRLGEATAVVATHLSVTGDALDPNGIIIGTGKDARLQRVIWDGHRFLFAWSRDAAIWFSTLDHATKSVVNLPAPAAFDLIARPNGGTLMLAVAERKLTVTAVDDQFHVTKQFLLDDTATNCRLVRSGNAMLAIWAHLNLPQDTTTVIAQRIDEDGTPTDIPAQLATLSTEYVSLAAAPALFAYGALGSVHVFAVQPNGTLNPLRAYEAENVASIVRTVDGGFIATEQAHPPAPTTFHDYDAGGNFRDRISLGSFDFPSLTVVQNGYVLAVALGQAPVSYFYKARRTKTISMIAPAQTGARLASDGTNVLLVWREYPFTLFAQLISLTGEPLHDRLNLGFTQSDASVSFDGTSYVVARPQIGNGQSEVVVQRVARDGSSAQEPFVIGSSTGHITNVVAAKNTIAWIDDARFSLPRTVWTTLDSRVPIEGSTAQQIALATDGSNVMLASLTQQNTITVSTPGAFEFTVPTQYSPQRVAIAGNGERWLLVYDDGELLWGQFLAHDGTPSGEPLLIGDTNESVMPHAVWDGDEFLATSDAFGDLAAVSARGVEHVIFPVSWPRELNGDAVYANGTVLFAYQRIDPDTTSSSRVFTRTLTRTWTRVRPSAP